ncbi:hypothetical protein [Paenibacillus sp. OV219]|uniref:hypothetical protein n=1 Tax=Paenibacillus sp. OV219 TaxID=1884377 RepID=UPI0008C96C6A|nr:hypothetical protein [Paenibacillus sp. OV219]SEO84159.1 hypothetical protein SAMN05518847_111153 [Paenibacillus sp. OV219]
MSGWRDSLEKRRVEWRKLEYAMTDTLAGRRVLRVAGPRSPRLTTPVSKAIRQEELAAVAETFDAGLACFCLGELSPQQRAQFLQNWHSRLATGATVVMADRRSEGCATPVELYDLFAPIGIALDVQVGRTFWWVRYKRR